MDPRRRNRRYRQPYKDPHYALLTLRTAVPLRTASCEATLHKDSLILPVHATHLISPQEVRLIKRQHLHAIHKAARFGGTICGFQFELDHPARTELSAFEQRLSPNPPPNPQAAPSPAPAPADARDCASTEPSDVAMPKGEEHGDAAQHQ